MALQRARRDYVARKEKQSEDADDGAVFGDGENRDSKRRKLEKQADVFGPAL